MADRSPADLEQLYEARFPADAVAAKRRVWQVLCDDFFSRFVRPTDTVLDLACGHGEFINTIACARRLAMDVNPAMRKYLAPNVTFVHGSCERLDGIAEGSIDLAFASNIFEHLPSKEALTSTVQEVRRRLRPGGQLLVMGPNIRYVGAAYWDFYDHLIPLTHLSCGELLASCGFAIETMIPRFLPFTTHSRLPQDPLLVKLYLRCRPAWRFLGGQFLLVGRA